jgi:MFS transporter, LPLT family, lysophospholipid transporter
VLIFVYALAAWFNTRIPRTGAVLVPMPKNPMQLLPDFWKCNATLWRDKLGQISLSTTTLFWGVSGNLRVIVLSWAALALGYSTTQASSLVGVVAVGTAVGAVVASLKMRLDHAPRVMPLGIVMGILVIGLNVIDNVWLAAPFLILLGAIGGFMVVPMNALLQHRGHNLMGAGRSIAVQNFNEQACILGMGFAYSFATSHGATAFLAITCFGLIVSGVMYAIYRWHAWNHEHHREELARLMHIARNDNLHG